MVYSLHHLHGKAMELNVFKVRKGCQPADRTKQALVAANRELITRMEAKIQATLARVCGEEPHLQNSL
jgi:hypothetical protein